MVNWKDKGHAEAMTSLPSNTSGSNTDTIISGTIEHANARYSTTYTNRTLTQQVKIRKTSQDGATPLSGAVFSLYTEKGYQENPKLAIKAGLTSNEQGEIDLGGLAYGTYYLVETTAPAGYALLEAPVVITVASSGVTYNQSGSNLSLSNGGVIHQNAEDPYTLIVTNNAGYELPTTGGPGTRFCSLLGEMMILLACTALVRKRRNGD